VVINVIVSDKKGAPVANLGPGDFEIRDDGHPQEIALFSAQTDEPGAFASSAPATLPDTYTNRFAPNADVSGNVVVILLDGLNTPPSDQTYAREQIVKFLRQIQPQDHVAIYTLGRSLSVLQNFTGDSSRLVAALAKYPGETTMDLEASTPTQLQTGDANLDQLLADAFQHEANFYIQERVDLTAAALEQIASYLAPIPGRKSLIWVSGSFPFNVGFDNPQDLLNAVNDPNAEQLLFAEDVERATRALSEANLAVYPVDARGLLGVNLNTNKSSSKQPGYGGMPQSSQNVLPGTQGTASGRGSRSPRLRPARNPTGNANAPTDPMALPDAENLATMDTLAQRTGGKAFYNSNDVFDAVRDALNDSRLTYEVGYYPSEVKWDGSFHTVSVRIRRHDLSVRAKEGYFALPVQALTPALLSSIATNAAIGPLEANAIPMAVRMEAARSGKAAALSATVFFDPHALQFVPQGEGFTETVFLLFAQLNSQRKIVNAIQQKFPLNLSSAQFAALMQKQVEYAQAIVLQPQASELRVVLCDGNSGEVGSVDVPLKKYLPNGSR
jgi:VWFA-related protein